MSSDLDWPAHLDRTDPAARERTSKFSRTLAQSFDDLEAELDRIGVDDYRYSFDAPSRKRDGRPYARARPDDPGFVLRWSMDGEQYAVACDHYTKLRDNVRAVYLYLREKRKMDQRPVVTGQSEFATARLPPGDDENVAVATNGALNGADPHDVLGVLPEDDEETIRARARALKKEHHPDKGGDYEDFKRVVVAEKVLTDAE